MTHGPLSQSAYRLFKSNPYGRRSLTEDARFEPTADTDMDTRVRSLMVQPFKPRTFVQIRTHIVSRQAYDRVRTLVYIHRRAGLDCYEINALVRSATTAGSIKDCTSLIFVSNTQSNSTLVHLHYSARLTSQYFYFCMHGITWYASFV